MCRWTCINNSLKFSVECLNDVGFVNIRNLSKKHNIPMGNILKKCIFCNEEIIIENLIVDDRSK